MAKMTKSEEIASLKQTVSKLNKKVEKLESNMSKPKKPQPKKTNWRKPVILLCVTFATLILVFSNIFFWTGRTIVDTNRYVSTVGPLIEQPAIQSGIASYTTTQLFNNVNVQSYVAQVLPPKASFLAPQLTGQLKTYTQSTIQKLLANSKVQNLWYSSLQKRHTALISFAKNYHGNGEITVSDIYSQLSKRLVGTPLSFLANKPLPAKVGSIQITTFKWLPAFRTLINNIDLWQFIAVAVFAVLLIVSLLLSPRKLKLIAKIGFFFAFFMIVTLISVRVMRGVVLFNVASAYQAAAQSAYDVILKTFISQTIDILIISLLISILAIITDKFKLVDKVKPEYRKLKANIVSNTKSTKK